MNEYEDSEEEDFEDEKRYQNFYDQEFMEEQRDKIYGDLKAKKRRILDNLLKTIPEHLQTKAKRWNRQHMDASNTNCLSKRANF